MIEPPVISDLVPHAGRMLLLERLLDSGADYVTCEVLVRADGMFDRDGRVPAWLGVEYMAQTIAAYSGLQAQASGQPLRLGFLLGSRRFETNVQDFICGEVLQVRAVRLLAGDSGLGAFECTLEGETARQRATLSVYSPADGMGQME